MYTPVIITTGSGGWGQVGVFKDTEREGGGATGCEPCTSCHLIISQLVTHHAMTLPIYHHPLFLYLLFLILFPLITYINSTILFSSASSLLLHPYIRFLLLLHTPTSLYSFPPPPYTPTPLFFSWACVLFKRTKRSCVLLRSFQKNETFLCSFAFFIKRTLRSLLLLRSL